jgi:glycosyltransferase involved in cell wall biosynthesis
VLHVIPNVRHGGADLCAIDMVRGLDQRGVVEARLCVLQGEGVPLERLKGLNEPVLMSFRGSHRSPREYMRFRRALRRVVAEWKPDIVHSHLWPACRWTSMALAGIDVKHVWHVHDTRAWLDSTSLRDRSFKSWTRLLLARVNPVLLAVSNAAAAHTARALGVQTSRFQRLPCGVDLQRYSPRPRAASTEPTVGMAAQFRPEKGHDVLLTAFKRLGDRGLRPRLLLAGDGSTLKASQALATSLSLDNVEFLGHVHDIPGFLAGLDLFVLPSTKFEGLPVSILEAMSMGIPVIATDVAGTGEVVIDGESGLLVAPSDADALASALHHAITGPEEMQRLAETARQLVYAGYSRDIVLRRLEGLYQETIISSNGSHATE